MDMKLAHLTLSLAIIAATTACAAERALSPQAAAPAVASSIVAPSMMQVPLLYVVDGVRLERDHVPSLSSDQISSVTVLKGHAALKLYGPDASYGAVVITTKAAMAGRS
jgi:hypothetical protein